MIELIVVMAIIIILLGIVAVGFRHVASGGQKRQTQTLLERLKNITVNTFNDKAASQRFFQQQIPAIYSNNMLALTASPPSYGNAQVWDGVPAAADDALFKTGVVFRSILADPEAKRIFDDIPTERKREFYFRNSNGERVDTPIAGATTPYTLPLDAWGNPILFVFDNWRTATSPTSDVPHNSTVNVNVPSGGLTDLYSDSTKTYWQFATRPTVQDPNYAMKYMNPATRSPAYTRVLDAAGNPVPALRSPDNRPFWASAGPDGKYETHDDNVYSFEN